MSKPIKQTKLNVGPGLYVLRYVGSVDPRTAPTAAVEVSSGSADHIRIISIPGQRPGALPAPGSGVIIEAAGAGAIEIRLEAFEGYTNFDAKFSLDLIGSSELVREGERRFEGTASTVEHDANQDLDREAVPLDLLAHVSLRGDIRADSDGWLAGPRMPSSIEGFQVGTGRSDVAVLAQFRSVLSRGAWSSWSKPGEWVGTRQKACALTGLKLKVVGDQNDQFELDGEALFLGAPRMSSRGTEIEFLAPGDLDPLIGLSLKLFKQRTVEQTAIVARPSRVRVFR